MKEFEKHLKFEITILSEKDKEALDIIRGGMCVCTAMKLANFIHRNAVLSSLINNHTEVVLFLFSG